MSKQVKKVSVNRSIIDSLKDNVPFDVTGDTDESHETVNLDEKIGRDNSKVKKSPKRKTKEERKIEPSENLVLSRAGVEFSKFDKDSKKIIYISKENHSKLTSIAKLTDCNIMDLADSLISDFMIKHKNIIKTTIKENMSNTWD